MENMLTPQDAADRLGVTVYRVHQLIRSGKLPATSYGRFYLIQEQDLALLADRKPGRPPKAEVKPAKKARRKEAKK